jgi:hypothetical protein
MAESRLGHRVAFTTTFNLHDSGPKFRMTACCSRALALAASTAQALTHGQVSAQSGAATLGNLIGGTWYDNRP